MNSRCLCSIQPSRRLRRRGTGVKGIGSGASSPAAAAEARRSAADKVTGKRAMSCWGKSLLRLRLLLIRQGKAQNGACRTEQSRRGQADRRAAPRLLG